MEIWIYCDDGADDNCIQQTKKTMEKLIDHKKYKIKLVKAPDIISLTADKMNKLALLILPGGRDIPYCEKLNGTGIENIQRYLNEYNGNYFGICAGAYFACRRVHFALNTELEVKGTRQLNLFDGTCCGPCIKPYKYDSRSYGSVATKIYCKQLNKHILCFYNGGGHFIPSNQDCESNTGNMSDNCKLQDDQCQKWQVIATFSNQSNGVAKHDQHWCCDDLSANNAVIFKKLHGGGRVLLSSVHSEFDGDEFKNDECGSLNTLSDPRNDCQRLLFFQYLLTMLGIVINSPRSKI